MFILISHYYIVVNVRGSFKKYVDFFHNFFSRRHIILRFCTHIWTTNSVDSQDGRQLKRVGETAVGTKCCNRRI